RSATAGHPVRRRGDAPLPNTVAPHSPPAEALQVLHAGRGLRLVPCPAVRQHQSCRTSVLHAAGSADFRSVDREAPIITKPYPTTMNVSEAGIISRIL